MPTESACERSAEHVPARPTWRCRNCGHEWPCRDARTTLTAESETCRTAVLAYLFLCQVDAAADLLPGGQEIDLHDRFIGWVKAAA